jgi:ATP-binding cassette subfamily B protein
MKELKTIIPYLRPYVRAIGVGLVMVVLANLFTIAGPYLLREAINGLGDPDITAARIGSYGLLIVAAALLGGAARYGMREILNGTSRRIECDLREDFFEHLLALDAGFYGTVRTGDLMSRATNDTLAVRMVAGPAIMYSVNTAVSFVFALALMIWLSPRLTLFALIPLVLLPPVVLGFGRIIHKRFEEIQEHYSTISTMVQENLTGLRIVRAYVQEDEQAREFELLNAEYLNRNMMLAKSAGLFYPTLSLLAGAGMVVVLWVGGVEVMAGRITVGDFVAFGFYLTFLIWPMIALGWVVSLFQRGAASMARLNQILQSEPAIRSSDEAVRPERIDGAIEFRQVSFRYPDTERTVLEDISFTVEPGTTVALVGPTGSGKSTLISLIPRLYDPSGGEVLVDGKPVPSYQVEDLRRSVGMVPQDPFLFSETIAGNIRLGLDVSPDDDPGEGPSAAVMDAARIAQLHDSIMGFPQGYGTLLGERGINLSGGQKQRATLARALARDPSILILDDALSAVDTLTEKRILEDLRSVLSGRTSFIISHRMSAVMNADMILVLDDGRIVERGTHAELLAMEGTYVSLLRRQMLEEELVGAQEVE